MASGQLNNLLHAPSRLSVLFKSFKPCLYNPNKRFSNESKGSSTRLTDQERAPSIAEEFERVAKEKLEEAGQGASSQTAEKTIHDAAEDPTLGDSKVVSGKERYNQHERKAESK